MDEYYQYPVVHQRNKSCTNSIGSTPSRNGSGTTPSRNGIGTNTPSKNHRHMVVEDDEDGGDPIECSGKSCKACTGGLIAECVAVCCCPCAVVNILALTFLKIPWMVGRKCLRMAKKKKLEKKKRKDDNMSYCYNTDRVISYADSMEGDGEGEGTLGVVNSHFVDEFELKDSFRARIDADEVWLELYQIGHMGFGRVSFTGINTSQGFDDMDSIFASPDDFKVMKHRDKIRGLHLLEYFVNRCHEIGIPCEAWMKRGDPKEVICHEVKRVQPDLLVVGCRGLGPFQRVFVGTVSEFCVKHAECPVVTIKRSAAETPQDPIDD